MAFGVRIGALHFGGQTPFGPSPPFETAYMRALHQVGYDMARKGYPWSKVPPGFRQ